MQQERHQHGHESVSGRHDDHAADHGYEAHQGHGGHQAHAGGVSWGMAQSQREVIRARNRSLRSMKVQAELGRYLGGRPPYGYMLVDAGPHPNRADARWGRRAWKLAPDPRTAVQVKWIFARRVEGMPVAGIARLLNERGVPCPSAVDPGRNRHRSGEGWGAPTVATILENPRYTGRQVWKRMANDRDEVDLRTGRPGQFSNLPQE